MYNKYFIIIVQYTFWPFFNVVRFFLMIIDTFLSLRHFNLSVFAKRMDIPDFPSSVRFKLNIQPHPHETIKYYDAVDCRPESRVHDYCVYCRHDGHCTRTIRASRTSRTASFQNSRMPGGWFPRDSWKAENVLYICKHAARPVPEQFSRQPGPAFRFQSQRCVFALAL